MTFVWVGSFCFLKLNLRVEVANDWKETDIMLSSSEEETAIMMHLSLQSVSIACLHHHQNV